MLFWNPDAMGNNGQRYRCGLMWFVIGQYVVMNKVLEHKGLQLSSIIAPVPTDRTKGILIYPSYYGHLVIGPTAEDQTDREVASVDKVRLICSLHFAY
jgi:L-2-hydroxyglutarate oxidase LhgO